VKTAIPGIAGLLFIFIACQSPAPGDARHVMQNACSYLWEQQAEDGGWHSETHTILRDGYALTPFILCVLVEVPDSVYQKDVERIARAIAFIRAHVRSRLETDSIPLILDYPNYTAAYALKVLVLNHAEQDVVLFRALTAYLMDQQFVEHRGILPADPAYGGWGFGETDLVQGTTGHVDLSHTRRVLQALSLTLPLDHMVFEKARIYLDRVQNDRLSEDDQVYLDGGFFTSIVTPETNKSYAVPGVEHAWFSYATATCDGLLARIAVGQRTTDHQVLQAFRWLRTHERLESPQGIPEDDPMQWHRVMKYYHLAVRGEVSRIQSIETNWSVQILEILKQAQLSDGSFMNPMGGPNKEDDPLLATAFAVIALR
jgi:hypothetical protein